MANTDPISDMLTRIRNAMMVGKSTATIPYSKLKLTILKLLVDTGFIHGMTVSEANKFKEIIVQINDPTLPPKITDLQRVSKPGRRLYAKANEIPRIMNGRGILIVSTSKGIMTDEQARKQQVGGELMCKVY